MKSYYQFDDATRKDTVNPLILIVFLAVWLFITVILFACLIPFKEYIFPSIVSIFLLGVLLLSYHSCKVAYGNVILLGPDFIEVYNYRNKLLRTIRFSEVKIAKNTVIFRGPNRYMNEIEEGLILYTNIELYEVMLFGDYRKDKEIFFIQNSELIEAICQTQVYENNISKQGE
jgi:hypothetical protein